MSSSVPLRSPSQDSVAHNERSECFSFISKAEDVTGLEIIFLMILQEKFFKTGATDRGIKFFGDSSQENFMLLSGSFALDHIFAAPWGLRRKGQGEDTNWPLVNGFPRS
jgi:hypothetical protein